MNELMNNTTYTFSALSAKYNNFHTPCYSIKTGGVDMVSGLGLYSDNVEIKQTIGNKSGQCTFSIQNCYDITAHRFHDSITKNFPLGQTIEAGLGYGTPTPLFKGYVSDVSFSFARDKAPSATIVCSDIRALMLQGRLNAMLPIASFAIMMPLLMLYYTSLLNMRVVYYDFWNILEDFRQNTNDFNYIYSYGEKRGYEFFILGDHSYFRKKWETTNPILTLNWGESLLSVDRNFTYSASQLKGTLNNILSLIPFLSDDLLKPSYPFKVTTPKMPNMQMDTSEAKNTLDLINIMATYIHGFGDDMVGGSVTCVGLPEIVPGRYIRLGGLDSELLDKSYYIDETTHSYNSGGYTTTFKISSGN